MNVLLTRCRKGLIIVTGRQFLYDGGANTLLGRLSRYWGNKVGPSVWVSRREVLNGTAILPG
ncbi:hypothetical protein BDQ17DRAFT_1366575 [Cyathus striatus]|nr:hypothetical protein BDQ17DRAFT_1366575 [Cyathus striatus]